MNVSKESFLAWNYNISAEVKVRRSGLGRAAACLTVSRSDIDLLLFRRREPLFSGYFNSPPLCQT